MKRLGTYTLGPYDMLFGLNGWMWECTSGRYGAIITNHRLINAHFPWAGVKAEPGREKLIYFGAEEFRHVAKLLKVRRTVVEQEACCARFEAQGHWVLADQPPEEAKK